MPALLDDDLSPAGRESRQLGLDLVHPYLQVRGLLWIVAGRMRRHLDFPLRQDDQRTSPNPVARSPCARLSGFDASNCVAIAFG
jgi:hypothetical protein